MTVHYHVRGEPNMRQHMLTLSRLSAYADAHGIRTRDHRGRRQHRSRRRAPGRGCPAGAHRTAGDPAGRERPEARVVLAGHRRAAGRHQADRAPQARQADREAMMTGYMTTDARTISMHAYEHAIRLGHSYLGSEHFLLALAAADQPAGAVLRGHGVTPDSVEAEIVRLAGAGLFGD